MMKLQYHEDPHTPSLADILESEQKDTARWVEYEGKAHVLKRELFLMPGTYCGIHSESFHPDTEELLVCIDCMSEILNEDEVA